MIVTNLELQTMGCTVCREVVEIPRKMMRDQHALLEMQDTMKQDHRECSANPDNPLLAAVSRRFRRDVDRELAKVQAACVSRGVYGADGERSRRLSAHPRRG